MAIQSQGAAGVVEVGAAAEAGAGAADFAVVASLRAGGFAVCAKAIGRVAKMSATSRVYEIARNGGLTSMERASVSHDAVCGEENSTLAVG